MNLDMKTTVVIGIGGNSLITSEDRLSIADQYQAVEKTVSTIIDAEEKGWKVVLTHGMGPQVGFVLERSEIAASDVITVPIDYASADIQGAIGYMFSKAIDNEYHRRGIEKKAVAVITRVIVDQNDLAFDNPSKPIGPFFDQVKAREKTDKFGWSIINDAGRGWRRAVPSPKPLEIIELNQISDLIDSNNTVIACGGGGIPVSRDAEGHLMGVEAVIDKDFTSSLLASKLGAEVLLLSTGVQKVAINFGTPEQEWIDQLTIKQALQLLSQKQFDPGSMKPKVEAIIQFIKRGGKRGIITNSENISVALSGNAGTQFIK